MNIFPASGKIDAALAKLRPVLLYLLGVYLVAAGCNSEYIKGSSSGDNLASKSTRAVCRESAVTGTRLKKRTCKPTETWAAIDEADRKNAQNFKQRIEEQSLVSQPDTLDTSGGRSMNPNTPN